MVVRAAIGTCPLKPRRSAGRAHGPFDEPVNPRGAREEEEKRPKGSDDDGVEPNHGAKDGIGCALEDRNHQPELDQGDDSRQDVSGKIARSPSRMPNHHAHADADADVSEHHAGDAGGGQTHERGDEVVEAVVPEAQVRIVRVLTVYEWGVERIPVIQVFGGLPERRIEDAAHDQHGRQDIN